MADRNQRQRIDEHWIAVLIAVLAVVVTVLLYARSCGLPAIYIDDGIPGADLDFKMGSPSGLEVLFVGWSGLHVVPWSANLFLLAGAICLLAFRYEAAVRLGTLAVVLGLTSWFFAWPFKDYRLLDGYYFWQASLVVLAGGARLALACRPSWRCHVPEQAREQMVA
jgi:hypothetical protein